MTLRSTFVQGCTCSLTHNRISQLENVPTSFAVHFFEQKGFVSIGNIQSYKAIMYNFFNILRMGMTTIQLHPNS